MAISKITSDAIDATGFNLDSNTLTIDSTNNRVGIGTTSPSSALHVKTASANPYVFIEGTSTADAGIRFNFNGGTFEPAIFADASALRFYDFTAGTERMRIDTSGNVGIGTSPSVRLDIDNGSLKVNRGNSSGDIAVFRGLNAEKVKIDTHGIKFNGDTAAANALDDYEEGTFTVTLLTTGSPNPTYTITNNTGYYTKVGRLVTANFYSGGINMTNAGSGQARISGLPFNATSTTYGQYSVVSFTHTTAFTSNVEGGFTIGGSTQIAVLDEGSVSSIAFTTGNPLYIMFTVTYWTD